MTLARGKGFCGHHIESHAMRHPAAKKRNRMTSGWQVFSLLLTIGTIVVIDKEHTKDSEQYKSKVVDIGEDFVLIDYPTHIESGRTTFIIDGTTLLVTFIDQNKISYAFKTEVCGRLNKGIPMLKLSYPGDDQLYKIQRREFVRVETPIDVAVLTEDGFHQFVAEDLSAGGIALNIPRDVPFSEGDTVKLTIVLPFINKEIKYVHSNAKLVRVWDKKGRTIASLQFEDIEDVDRQYIIRFCFERQLQTRNRES
ncbi:flagellar brake domain-containing protein [Sporosarcina sp. 179-K 3D1 HS]|uniref:flagellar brake protein n=1 Tax=Sporosarcina sp. 179-K 3D1 HS TaxID=3232169 RepID=UPI0039A090E2